MTQSQQKQYKLIKLIGKGNYGNVLLCEDEKGEELVLKAIKRDFMEEKYQNSYKSELEILQKMEQIQNQKEQAKINKSKIVKLKGFQDKYTYNFNNRTNSCHALFLEYLPNGSLSQYIKQKEYKQISFSVFRAISLQIIQGLKELYDMGIVHRDIKDDNIVFDKEFDLKLIDLSFANKKSNEVCGTLKYMAPELLLLEQENNAFYERDERKKSLEINQEEDLQKNQKIDIFAAGIVLFRLATKDFPFYNASLFDFKYKHIVNHEYDKFWKKQPKFIIKEVSQILVTPQTQNEDLFHFQDELLIDKQHQEEKIQIRNQFIQLRDLFQKMLAFNIEERLNIQQILDHSFFKDYQYANQQQVCEFFEHLQQQQQQQNIQFNEFDE